MARLKTVAKRTTEGDAAKRMAIVLKKATPVQSPFGHIKKPHRYRPGTAAMMEIRREQKSTDLRIPMARVRRIIRKAAQDIKPDCKFRKEALEAIHQNLEAHLAKLFKDSYDITMNAGRMTLNQKDVNLRRQFIRF